MTSAAMHGHDAHPAPSRAKVSALVLWFGLFGGPAAWSVQTLVNLPVASHGCFPRLNPLSAPATTVRGAAFAVSLVAMAICIAALVVSARAWSRTRAEHHESTGAGRRHAPATALLETGEGRTRFMALSGMLTSATFLVASITHMLAIFLVAPCAS
jgi:hypothetical protein